MIVVLFITSLFLLLAFTQVQAGLLNEFESDVTKKPQNKKHCSKCGNTNTKNGYQQNTDGKSSGNLFDLFFDSVVSIFSFDGDNTHESTHQTYSAHTPSESVTPLQSHLSESSSAKVSINVQSINEDILGVDVAAEARFGKFGYGLRQTSYADDSANETLSFEQYQGFYRLTPIKKYYAIDVGIGYGKLQGVDSKKGLVLSMPMILNSAKKFGLEIRPSVFITQESEILELDTSVYIIFKKSTLRYGYRTLRSVNSDISGPYLGVDVLF